MESSALTERSDEILHNQKLALLDGFLLVDDWPHAQVLFERLAPLHPVVHEQISSGLIRFCSYLLLYGSVNVQVLM
ncbi:hypothetical protein M758_UG167700 [Ceratodon purpureus]|nr:hypothetical protein M758_UG167700 [Ceratodon purpureus]